jgi:hypothetical protein
MGKNDFNGTSPVFERIFGNKSSQNIFHASFPELAARETAEKLKREDVGRRGTVYPGKNLNERPAKGAFVIVPEEGAAEMFYALVANGLVKFSQRIAMDFSYKPITVSKDPLHIEALPVESEMVRKHPRFQGDTYYLASRIVIVDPQFIDARGNPTTTELPKTYSEQVLKALNPFEFFKSFSATLDDMLKRAGANAAYFKQILVDTAKKWKGRQAPKDAGTLERFATLAILHEATHFLICHLPDDLSSLSPEERKRQSAFSVDRYLEILNADKTLNMEYAKNLIKALKSLRDDEPSKATEHGISMVVLIETFCDRFSVFLFENYLKIQIYQSVFGDLYGDPFSVSTMLNFEEERKKNPAEFMAKHPEVTQEALDALDRAEITHVYIKKYKDAVLDPDERAFFRGFLDLLKHFDKQDTILQFTPEHMETSRIVNATFSGLINRAGVGIMEEMS